MFDRYSRARRFSLLLPPLIVGLAGLITSDQMAEIEWLRVTELATHGVITPLFIRSLATLGVLLGVVTLVGGIKLDDLGLDRDYFGRGVGVSVMIWCAAQVVGVLPRVVAERPVVLDPVFEHGSRWEISGNFLAALGNATVEEIAFRGFLLVQLYLLFHAGSKEPARGLGGAVATSLIVANLAALPRLLPYASTQAAIESQAVLLGIGLFLTWIFLRTKNIFFTIGVHALIASPTPIVAGPRGGGTWFHPLVIAILASVWAILWPSRD